MRAGHSCLKARLSRLNIVSTAECEYIGGLETGEHIFWDCKLHEEQRATIMAILSENSKKGIPKVSYRVLKARGKRLMRGVCFFKFFLNSGL
jgi:hypothetical protein